MSYVVYSECYNAGHREGKKAARRLHEDDARELAEKQAKHMDNADAFRAGFFAAYHKHKEATA